MSTSFFTKITILSALCMLITLFGMLACQTIVYEETPVETLIIEMPDYFEHYVYWKSNPQKETAKDIEPEFYAHFEEEVNMSALFYAVKPIGTYYITAYSDKETGCKKTASGTTVHQGNITTCASDVRVLGFGTYIEVDGRLYRCEDTGSGVRGKHIDCYEPSMKKLNGYTGYKTVYKVEFPFGKPQDN